MNSDTLVLVHVLARHGNRCPDTFVGYPNDPHKSNKYYPYGHGMLTNIGKKNMYKLGTYFRERYNNYLGDVYLPEHLETWTSQAIRTRTSAQLFLAGLFPPNDLLKWHEDLNWQPIHTHYHPAENDELLAPAVKLQKFLDAYYKMFDEDLGKAFMKKYEDIIPYLEEHSGVKNISNTRRLAILYDCLKTESEFGLPLPEWTKAVYPEKLTEAFHDEMAAQTATKELRRIVCGKLLKKILTDAHNKIDKKSQCKMHFYSGHDINISYVLIALGLMYKHHPQYCASLTFEVHQIDNRYGIKLFYKKSVEGDFELMTFKNGEDIMWIEDWEELVNDLWNDKNKL